MRPIICTSNTFGHIDYGVPLYVSKSTDYRTSTGTYHRQIPCVPQYFDCRVKARIKDELSTTGNVILSDKGSTYDKTYLPKFNQSDITEKNVHTACSRDVHYNKTLQEKICQTSPAPLKPCCSEMKDSFKIRCDLVKAEPFSVDTASRCEIVGYQRASQRAIPPEERGFWKHLDIYLTENRLKYCPYDITQMEESKNDIITYYSGTGQYKELKKELPNRLTGNRCIFDKKVFREQYPNKFLSRGQKRVPNFGMQTECQAHYTNQTLADQYPNLQTTDVHFPVSLTQAGPWQNLCPPGMYCTEYCHIGTGWPVRSVINIEKEIKDLKLRKRCNSHTMKTCEIK